MEVSRQPQMAQYSVETKKTGPSGPVEETKKPSEDRIVLLSDGIFAIAVTLLVLSIPTPSGHDLDSEGAFIAVLKDGFLTGTLFYFITFAILASYWLGHRRLMNMVNKLDRSFIWLNLLFLAFVALFPVATNVVQHAKYPEAVVVYAVILAGCGYSSILLWIYALGNHRLVADDMDADSHKVHAIGTATSPTFILLSLCLLFIPAIRSQPSNVFFSWLLLPFIHNITKRVTQKIVNR